MVYHDYSLGCRVMHIQHFFSRPLLMNNNMVVTVVLWNLPNISVWISFKMSPFFTFYFYVFTYSCTCASPNWILVKIILCFQSISCYRIWLITCPSKETSNSGVHRWFNNIIIFVRTLHVCSVGTFHRLLLRIITTVRLFT